MTSPEGDGFFPGRLLQNGHAQSVLASLKLRRPLVRRRARSMLAAAESHILDCGGGVRLQGWFSGHGGEGRDLVVLFHGWEGSVESLYLLSAAGRFFRRGFDVFRLNFRDHGPTHHLNPGLFHACRIDEVVGAMAAVQDRFPRPRTFVAGFSLGGNFALRTAVRAADAGIRLAAVAAVCPVLDPVHTMHVLETGWSPYHRYFMKKWRRSLREKRRRFPHLSDLTDLARFRTLREMTDFFAPRYTGFPSGEAYLKGYAITGDRLAGLHRPSLMLLSADDPVIPIGDLAHIARPPALTVETTRYGGHCGFLAGWGLRSWAEDRVIRFFGDHGAQPSSD